MTAKTMGCPDCKAMMQYRLGEFECDECGKKLPASAEDNEEHNLSRRPAPSYRPGARSLPGNEFNVERGRR
jgi:hypothetical protein